MTMTATESRSLRTVTQAMTQLSCSRTTIYKLCREGKLEMVKFGARTRITERSLTQLLDEMFSSGRIRGPSIQPDDQED